MNLDSFERGGTWLDLPGTSHINGFCSTGSSHTLSVASESLQDDPSSIMTFTALQDSIVRIDYDANNYCWEKSVVIDAKGLRDLVAQYFDFEILGIECINKSGELIFAFAARDSKDSSDAFEELQANSFSYFIGVILSKSRFAFPIDFQPAIVKMVPKINSAGGEMVLIASADEGKVYFANLDELCASSSNKLELLFDDFSSPVLTLEAKFKTCRPNLESENVESILCLAFGSIDGNIRCCFQTNSSSLNDPFFSNLHYVFDGPISCLHLFEGADSKVSLMVGDCLGNMEIFFDLLNQGFSQSVTLPGSLSYDSVYCCKSIEEVELNDMNEKLRLIIGTFSQNILIYTINVDGNNAYNLELELSINVGGPVFNLDYFDTFQEGLQSLLIHSTQGIGFLKQDYDKILKIMRNVRM